MRTAAPISWVLDDARFSSRYSGDGRSGAQADRFKTSASNALLHSVAQISVAAELGQMPSLDFTKPKA